MRTAPSNIFGIRDLRTRVTSILFKLEFDQPVKSISEDEFAARTSLGEVQNHDFRASTMIVEATDGILLRRLSTARKGFGRSS